jgi:TPP-dependent pyruvate/acetoin dehydrogenase alpha subunit
VARQTCMNRAFELEVATALNDRVVRPPVYLSIGTEHIPPIIKYSVTQDFKLFAQHRCHSYFLTMGGSPELLGKELMGRDDGCNGGMGGSASVSLPNMFGHSGLLGDQVPIATGYADASQELTVCVFGDAAAEEDYALASFGYATTKQCPIIYICEDNDLSILTHKKVRRSWDVVEVAKGFGMEAYAVYDYEIFRLNAIISRHTNGPLLINIRCCRHRWHSGAGIDGDPDWDTYNILKESIPEMSDLEQEYTLEMREMWNNLRSLTQ